MIRIKLSCPRCGKGYKLSARQNETMRCGYCGYCGPKEEFIIKEKV